MSLSISELAHKMRDGGSHLSRNETGSTPVAPGVPTIASRINVVFDAVTHPAATGVCSFGNPVHGYGSSASLASSRPYLPYGSVWCGLCNKPCDFEEDARHNLFGKKDEQGYHRGYIAIQARCHGEESNILTSFKLVRDNEGRQIIAFPFPKIIAALPARQLALPAPGDSHWTRPVKRYYSIPIDPQKVAAFLYVKAVEVESDFEKITREIMERFEKRQK